MSGQPKSRISANGALLSDNIVNSWGRDMQRHSQRINAHFQRFKVLFFNDFARVNGAHIIHFRAFPDHHPFTEDEIEEVASWKRRSNGDFLLTTEKDWVRIDGKFCVDPDIAILTIKIGLLSGEDEFFDIIRQGIRSRSKS